jgi:hypothetical protein
MERAWLYCPGGVREGGSASCGAHSPENSGSGSRPGSTHDASTHLASKVAGAQDRWAHSAQQTVCESSSWGGGEGQGGGSALSLRALGRGAGTP